MSLNGLYANDRVKIITEADPEELERVVSKTVRLRAEKAVVRRD